jgi:hypothetical protein
MHHRRGIAVTEGDKRQLGGGSTPNAGQKRRKRQKEPGKQTDGHGNQAFEKGAAGALVLRTKFLGRQQLGCTFD